MGRIEQQPEPGSYALASTQREIWFDQMLNPASPRYNIGGYLECPFAVDVPRLRDALNRLVDRHDALRIRIVMAAQGIPLQRFEERLDDTLPVHDLSALADPEGEARSWMEAQMRRPFDLADVPLFQIELLRLADERYWLFTKYHHLLVDGWAIAYLSHEFAGIYESLGGVPWPMDPPVSYKVFLDGEEQYFRSDKCTADREYWGRTFNRVPEPLLPIHDAHRLAGLDRTHDTVTLTIARPDYDRLNGLFAERRASAFHVILGVLYAYFTRCFDRDDLVVGLPVLNRGGAALKRLVGLCVGMSPVRFRLGRDLSFGELVGGIAEELRQVYRRQRLPVSEINRLAGLDEIGRRQLFDIALSFERHDYRGSIAMQRVHVRPLLNHHHPVPLSVFVREFHATDDVELQFSYGLAYLDGTEAERLALRIRGLLESVLESPDAPVRSLSLLTAADREQLVRWNRNDETLTPHATVVEQVQDIARTCPDNLAITDGTRDLSYAALDRITTALARRLADMGVGREATVGVFMTRSIEAVVALLGVMKAGGTFMPLDPAYPEGRIRLMLDETGARAIVTDRSVKDRVAGVTGRTLSLDAEWDGLCSQPASDWVCPAGARDPAYLIYTSGSTGIPKGVIVEHRGLLNHAITQARILAIGPGSRMLQFAGIGFDAFLAEVFPTLVGAATLHLADAERLLPGPQLIALMDERRITHAVLTPSVLNALPDAPLPHLRVLVSAAETCTAAIVRKWGHGRRLLNGYGPTEATIGVSIGECRIEDARPTIGTPRPNVRVHILDPTGERLPPGVPGEICIAGMGVARGYLNRAELTAERFVEIAGLGRVYRSGDLGRWLPDGRLEHLGRLDQQVKVRGFRVEPGEIETALSACPGIDEAAVVATGDPPNEKLVAYLVGTGEPSRMDLRSLLARRLPEFMIPSVFVTLDALPRTTNGKVDRGALAGRVPVRQGADYVPPVDEPERRLQAIWQQVLDIDRIGVTDSFFDLGGTSIQAATLVNEIENVLGIAVPLGALFEHPTIRMIARYMERHGRVAGSRISWPLLLPIQPEGHALAFFCSPGANGGGFYLHQLARGLGTEIPFYALQIPGMDDVSKVPKTIEEIADIHLGLIDTVQPSRRGPYRLGGHSSGGVIAFELARRLEARGDRVELLAIFDTSVIQFDKADRRADLDELAWLGEILHLLGEDAAAAADLQLDSNGSVKRSGRFMAFMMDVLIRHEMLPRNVRVQQVETLLEVWRGVSDAHAAYRPACGIAAPIQLYLAEEVPRFGVALEERRTGWGWDRLTSGGVEILEVPGNHVNMLSDPHVSKVAEALRRRLDGSRIKR